MKVAIIGDPHGSLDKIKKIPLSKVDLVLCTGDIGKADLARQRFFENVERKRQGLKELDEDAKHKKEVHMEIHKSTIDVLKYLSKYAPVYTIQGNVGIPTDSQTRKDNEKWKLNLPSTKNAIERIGNVYLIKNRLRIIDDLRIGFLEYFTDTCWVREFKPTDYQKRMIKAKRQTEKANRVLESFGSDLDILVFHQPPYGILDKVGAPAPLHWRGKHAGSKTILNYIEKRQPRYAFCGHIHEGEGKDKIGKTEVYNLGVAEHKIIEI
jgi:Icc-related predicted phosphoesterase